MMAFPPQNYQPAKLSTGLDECRCATMPCVGFFSTGMSSSKLTVTSSPTISHGTDANHNGYQCCLRTTSYRTLHVSLHLASFQSRIPNPASTRRLLPNQNQAEPSKQGIPSPTPSTLHKPFRKPGHPQIPQKKTAYPHTDPALGHLYLSTRHISIHVLISDPPTPQNPLTKISSDPLASLTSLVVPSHPLPDRASTLVSTTSI